MILGYFFYFSIKAYTVGTHQNCLSEAIQIGTQIACFYGEMEKIFLGNQTLRFKKIPFFMALWNPYLSNTAVWIDAQLPGGSGF